MNQNIQNHQYKGPPGTKQKKAVSEDSSSDVLLYEKKQAPINRDIHSVVNEIKFRDF